MLLDGNVILFSRLENAELFLFVCSFYLRFLLKLFELLGERKGMRVDEMHPSGHFKQKIAQQRTASKLLLPFNAAVLQRKRAT